MNGFYDGIKHLKILDANITELYENIIGEYASIFNVKIINLTNIVVFFWFFCSLIK